MAAFTWTTRLSHYAPDRVVSVRIARCGLEWADLPCGQAVLENEGRKCVFSFYLHSAIALTLLVEALAASTVKVQGKDVMATWKVLISIGGAPILYSLYAFLATIVAIKAGAPLRWRIWTPFLVMIALPIIGYFALKFGEAGMDVLKWVLSLKLAIERILIDLPRSLRPLIVSLVPGQQKELNKAKKMREELQAEVSATIEEFGPKMHQDFDEVRR